MSFYDSSGDENCDQDVRSGISGNNALHNKSFLSGDGCRDGGRDGAAHRLSARNIHNLQGGRINKSNNIHIGNDIKPRMNHTHSYMTNVTTTMTTSASYKLNGWNINTDIVLSDNSNDNTIHKQREQMEHNIHYYLKIQSQHQQHQLCQPSLKNIALIHVPLKQNENSEYSINTKK